jgi:hypothetical protein
MRAISSAKAKAERLVGWTPRRRDYLNEQGMRRS